MRQSLPRWFLPRWFEMAELAFRSISYGPISPILSARRGTRTRGAEERLLGSSCRPRPVHSSCGDPRWRRSAGIRPTCASRSQKLAICGTVKTCAEVSFSRSLMRQPSRSLPRTHKTGFLQRRCSMARPLVVLMLIAAQRSSPRSAQRHSQGDARRDSGGAASHWSIPEPLGPAEARRGHQRS